MLAAASTDRTVDVARTRIGMGAENRGDTFCEDRTEVGLELRRGREEKAQFGLR